MNSTQICLDTNVWLTGLAQQNPYSARIIALLPILDVAISNQIRAEILQNLSPKLQRRFFDLLTIAEIDIDYEPVPHTLIKKYQSLGLKKGDTIIAAYCEWREVKHLLSLNRHFSRELSDEIPFKVLSPDEFCDQYFFNPQNPSFGL